MNDQKQQIVDKLKGANNILVTVSSSPSVDQLAACIGLTLLLNKLKKHATAVFSGDIPSTIEFLQPENTLEKNTDSLRDFIIALDKSKADKLRYKVEDKVVKIFITPYRTSISQDDLDFSQGDFNVDVVLALGVHEQQDLDQAITSHGRILHDATVASVNTAAGSELGTLNWTDPGASSLSELVTELSDALGKDLIDAQIATALLTGIVAETDRFSNEKTSPSTMSLSSELMAAGANQQLVATKLQESALPPEPPPSDSSSDGGTANPGTDHGTLEIEHAKPTDEPDKPDDNRPESGWPPMPSLPSEPPQDNPPMGSGAPTTPGPEQFSNLSGGPTLVMQPPSLGGTLTANTVPEGLDPATDPLSLPEVEPPMLNHDTPSSTSDSAVADSTPPPPLEVEAAEPVPPLPTQSVDTQIHIDEDGNLHAPTPAFVPPTNEPAGDEPAEPDGHETLTDLEEAVHSPHVDGEGDEPAISDVDSARSAVQDAINSSTDSPLEPLAALNAQPVNLDLHDDYAAPVPPDSSPEVAQPTANMTNEPAPGISPADQPLDMPLPPGLAPRPANSVPPTSSVSDPSAPPPVPPPMMPPDFFDPNQGR